LKIKTENDFETELRNIEHSTSNVETCGQSGSIQLSMFNVECSMFIFLIHALFYRYRPLENVCIPLA